MLDKIISAINIGSEKQKTLLTPRSVNPGLIKRNIALKEGRLCNLKVASLKNYFVELALKHFTGKTYLGNDERFWFVFSILRSNKDRLKYFRDSVEFHGLCSLMCELLDELRLNGITSRDLESLPLKDKWNDVSLILHKYEEKKNAENHFDYTDAVLMLMDNPEITEDVFVISFSKTRFEDELIRRLSIKVIDTSEIFELKYELDAYRTDTPYQEALQTIRNLYADFPISAERIGICVPDYNRAFNYFTSVIPAGEKGERFHFLKGEPFFKSSAGKLWNYLSEWALNNFSVYRLIKVLESGHFHYSRLGDNVEAKNYYKAIGYFKKAEVPLFNKEFHAAFIAFLLGKKKISEDDAEKPDLTDNIRELAVSIEKIFLKVVMAESQASQIKAMSDIIRRFCHNENETDQTALKRFGNLIEDVLNIKSLQANNYNLEDLINLITENLNGIYLKASLPDYQKPVVGTLDDFMYAELDKLYCLGMNEKGLPHRVMQNPLLLDYEKKILKDNNTCAQFYLSEEILKENDNKFYSVLNNVKGKVVFSAPMKDLSTGREYLVSRYLLNEWNRKFNENFDYQRLASVLKKNDSSKNNFVAEEPHDSFHSYEAAVSVISGKLDYKMKNEKIEGTFHFAENIKKYKDNFRETDKFNEYWGNVGADKERDLGIMSASGLETWSRCPYKYFLGYEMHLEQPEDFDPDDLKWLDSRQYGIFLHSLFEKFLVKLGENNGKPVTEVKMTDEKLLKDLFDQLLGEFRVSNPVKSAAYYEMQKNQLWSDALRFLQEEAKNKNERLEMEFVFGKGNGKLEGGDNNANAVSLKNGSKVKFSGKIDRIDKTDTGYVLVDYKSGKPHEWKADKPFGGGILIQAGLYPLIFSQIDPQKHKNVAFQYYYSTVKHDFKKLDISFEENQERFRELLTKVVDQISIGNFMPSGKSTDSRYGGNCSYCDFNSICGEGRISLYERCKENVEAEAVKAYNSITEEE